VSDWWKGFFDEDYVALWGRVRDAASTEAEADAIWRICGLAPGSRVLDAPCGYGRLSSVLARRGATVVGVDQSEALLAEGERTRGDVGADRLRYVLQDLRTPLAEGGFEVALNVYSSLGYGTEDDDLAILRTLAGAVRRGGLVFVETMHRDRLMARGGASERGNRLDDGTLFVEVPRFDAVAGRIDTTWYWSGPNGAGQKSASIRIYSATELVDVMARAGLRFRSAHAGASDAPFDPPSTRLGILAEKT
jgi:SAM-dependent methyltransferase